MAKGNNFFLVFGLTASAGTAALPIFNYWLDGTRVFSGVEDGYTEVEPNYRYGAVRGVLVRDEVPEVIVFGSSRINNGFDTQQEPDIYKLTYPAGHVHEHVDALRAILAAGVTPPEVWLAIDPDLNFYLSRETAEAFTNTIPYPTDLLDRLQLYRRLLFKRTSDGDLGLALGKLRGEAHSQPLVHYIDQREAATQKPSKSHERKLLAMPPYRPRDFVQEDRYDELLDEVHDFLELCSAHGVRCQVFITPRLAKTWLAQDFDMEEGFKRELAALTPFHDFESLHPLNVQPRYWIETNHFVADVGARVMEGLRGVAPSDDPYGELVTADSVDEHLAGLRAEVRAKLSALLLFDPSLRLDASLRSSLRDLGPELKAPRSLQPEGPALQIPPQTPAQGGCAVLRLTLTAGGECRLVLRPRPKGEAVHRQLVAGENELFLPLSDGALENGCTLLVRGGKQKVELTRAELWGIGEN